jgi:hypothetical protein
MLTSIDDQHPIQASQDPPAAWAPLAAVVPCVLHHSQVLRALAHLIWKGLVGLAAVAGMVRGAA